MTEETTTTPPSEEPYDGTAEPSADTAQDHGEAWGDVLSQIDALGEAISRWTRAAVNDPENRARAHEVKDHVEQMANSVSDAVGDAVETDIGQQIKDAATKTGEAIKAASTRVGDEVAPRMASAFRVAAEKLHQAAERMEKPDASEPDAHEEPEFNPSDR